MYQSPHSLSDSDSLLNLSSINMYFKPTERRLYSMSRMGNGIYYYFKSKTHNSYPLAFTQAREDFRLPFFFCEDSSCDAAGVPLDFRFFLVVFGVVGVLGVEDFLAFFLGVEDLAGASTSISSIGSSFTCTFCVLSVLKKLRSRKLSVVALLYKSSCLVTSFLLFTKKGTYQIKNLPLLPSNQIMGRTKRVRYLLRSCGNGSADLIHINIFTVTSSCNMLFEEAFDLVQLVVGPVVLHVLPACALAQHRLLFG